MNRSELQRLLNQEAAAPADGLPENFAGEILAKGKRLRRLLRQHWKSLAVASFVSLLIAIAFGLGAAPSSSHDSAPPLLLFQGNSDGSPFSSK
ncbi:MAG: hypothetical protein P1U86_17480 [Verrucomicrobiales bacterium]|nr:hypothetical protein [Verrucomicrobiales bacterium]